MSRLMGPGFSFSTREEKTFFKYMGDVQFNAYAPAEVPVKQIETSLKHADRVHLEARMSVVSLKPHAHTHPLFIPSCASFTPSLTPLSPPPVHARCTHTPTTSSSFQIKVLRKLDRLLRFHGLGLEDFFPARMPEGAGGYTAAGRARVSPIISYKTKDLIHGFQKMVEGKDKKLLMVKRRPHWVTFYWTLEPDAALGRPATPPTPRPTATNSSVGGLVATSMALNRLLRSRGAPSRQQRKRRAKAAAASAASADAAEAALAADGDDGSGGGEEDGLILGGGDYDDADYDDDDGDGFSRATSATGSRRSSTGTAVTDASSYVGGEGGDGGNGVDSEALQELLLLDDQGSEEEEGGDGIRARSSRRRRSGGGDGGSSGNGDNGGSSGRKQQQQQQQHREGEEDEDAATEVSTVPPSLGELTDRTDSTEGGNTTDPSRRRGGGRRGGQRGSASASGGEGSTARGSSRGGGGGGGGGSGGGGEEESVFSIRAKEREAAAAVEQARIDADR
jgi:hypothetical protein